MCKRVLYPIICLLFSVCLQAQTSVASYPKTLLWRISGNGLQKDSYLYGTMHLRDKRLFHFTDSLYACLEKAEGFALEVDVDEATEAIIKAISGTDNSGYLYEDADKEEFAKEAKALESKLGIPAKKITKRQAWLYKVQTGWGKGKEEMPAAMDLYLYNIARRQGKKLGGVEDIDDQLGIIDAFGSETDIAEIVAKKSSGAGQLERMIAAYNAADLDAIGSWGDKELSEQQRMKMLVMRNVKMARRMDSMVQAQSNFFAIGAAHLPGPDGLIEALRNKGYEVQPVMSNKKLAPEQYTYTAKEAAWKTFESSDSTFSLQTPAKLVSYTDAESGMDMYLTMDVATGQVYVIKSLPVAAGKTATDLMETMKANMLKASPGCKTEVINFAGRQVLQAYYNEKQNYYRARLVPHGNEVIMMVAGAQQKAAADNEETARFFTSLRLHTAATGTAPKSSWQVYTDTGRAFSISFPGKPEAKSETTAATDGGAWQIQNLTLLDVAGNAYYMVSVKETPVTYYITDDQNIFEETKKALEENAGYRFWRFETGDINGDAAAWLEGIEGKENLSLKSVFINRGNKAYLAMVIYDSLKSRQQHIDSFITSFKLQPFKQEAWHLQAEPVFATKAPAPFQRMPPAQNMPDGYTISAYDKNSSFSFSIDVEALSPYYWCSSDSAFFAGKAAEYIGADDSVLYEKGVQNGSAKGREYLVRMAEGRNFKKFSIFLNGDSTYLLNLVAPERFIQTPAYNQFFENFRFAHLQTNTGIYQSKAANLLQDLRSDDETASSAAAQFLDKAPFVKKELPLLHEALLYSYAGEENDDAVYETLSDKVLALADESTVSFIQDRYASLQGDREAVKYKLLLTLAQIKTGQAYDVLKKLVTRQPPTAGDPGGMAYAITDSLQLAKTLYPELLQLSEDDLFSGQLAFISNELLDSALITQETLAPYHDQLIAQAQKQYDDLEADDIWRFYSWVYLLGSINNAPANKLLQEVIKHKSVDLKQEAIVALLKNGQPVAPAEVEKVAASLANRASLYRELEKLGKAALFPAKYGSQKSIAEGELYEIASDDEAPASMQFIGERKAMFEGKLQQFYLFRLTYVYENDEKETYLGVTGGYTAGNKTVVHTTRASGFAGRLYSDKEINGLLQQYLQETETYLAKQASEK